MRVHGVALLVAATVLVPRNSAGQDTERSFVEIPWRTAWEVGTTAEDTTLLMPTTVAQSRSLAVVVDATNSRVVAIRKADGSVAWIYARRGRGPMELMRPSDVALTESGSFLVVDASSWRVLELAPDGEPVREVNLRSELSFPPVRLIYQGESRPVLLVGPLLGMPLISTSLDRSGPVARVPFPMDSIPSGVRFIPRAESTGDGTWVLANGLGPNFAIVEGSRATVHPHVQDTPFTLRAEMRSTGGGLATAAPGAPPMVVAARDVTIACDRVFILFGPTDSGNRTGSRVVDVYRMDGSYEASFRLPEAAYVFKTDGQTSIALTREPWPRMWRLDVDGGTLCDSFGPG